MVLLAGRGAATRLRLLLVEYLASVPGQLVSAGGGTPPGGPPRSSCDGGWLSGCVRRPPVGLNWMLLITENGAPV